MSHDQDILETIKDTIMATIWGDAHWMPHNLLADFRVYPKALLWTHSHKLGVEVASWHHHHEATQWKPGVRMNIITYHMSDV